MSEGNSTKRVRQAPKKRRLTRRGLPPSGFSYSLICTVSDWLAYGPSIVAAKPVARIDFSDLGAFVCADGRCFIHCYAGSIPYPGNSHVDFVIPRELWKNLPRSHTRGGNTVTYFRCQKTAKAALSKAALKWARKPTRNQKIVSVPYSNRLNFRRLRGD